MLRNFRFIFCGNSITWTRTACIQFIDTTECRLKRPDTVRETSLWKEFVSEAFFSDLPIIDVTKTISLTRKSKLTFAVKLKLETDKLCFCFCCCCFLIYNNENNWRLCVDDARNTNVDINNDAAIRLQGIMIRASLKRWRNNETVNDETQWHVIYCVQRCKNSFETMLDQ